MTILFKRLHQPLVLGYIVAGFLTSPHMGYTPSVTSMEGIEEWSEIGVIFLMFTLGLEFSFKHIVKMGVRPVLTTLMIMGGMIGLGGMVATLFGWNSMDRLFLCGMLCISSTTIIYKAFDEFGLRTKRFASGVISVLILEDIMGILLMVILSALAVTKKFEGFQLLESLIELSFFLLLWFMVGIYVVPLLLKKTRRYINNEVLIVVSVGMCFLMAVLASRVGYSPAFGAFMMGSILAETLEAENIDKAVRSIRDLFGAVFFVSVGMMVEPGVLIEYWLPILVLTLTVVLGKMIFGSFSFLICGSGLRGAISSGFSMVQIGEFSFIIAALGESLQVTSSFLYPVVVAVSIITTFLTPYIIRLSPHVSDKIERLLPAEMQLSIKSKRRVEVRQEKQQSLSAAQAFRSFLTDVLYQTSAFLTITIALVLFSFATLKPLCEHFLSRPYSTVLCIVVLGCVLSPCIRPIAVRKNNSREAKFLRGKNNFWRNVIRGCIAMKYLLCFCIMYYVVAYVSDWHWMWNAFVGAIMLCVTVWSRTAKYVSIRIERTFKQNLRQRDQHGSTNYGRRLRGKDLHISRIKVPLHSKWGGKTLSQLHFGHTDHIHIVAIIRAGQRINIPGGNNKIFAGDELEIVSGAEALNRMRDRAQQEVWQEHELSDDAHRLSVISLRLTEGNFLVGHTLMDINFRIRFHCMVLGVEDECGHLSMMEAQRPFRVNDTIWVVGEEADLSLLNMAV